MEINPMPLSLDRETLQRLTPPTTPKPAAAPAQAGNPADPGPVSPIISDVGCNLNQIV